MRMQVHLLLYVLNAPSQQENFQYWTRRQDLTFPSRSYSMFVAWSWTSIASSTVIGPSAYLWYMLLPPPGWLIHTFYPLRCVEPEYGLSNLCWGLRRQADVYGPPFVNIIGMSWLFFRPHLRPYIFRLQQKSWHVLIVPRVIELRHRVSRSPKHSSNIHYVTVALLSWFGQENTRKVFLNLSSLKVQALQPTKKSVITCFETLGP